MVKIKLYEAKKTPKSKVCYFFGFKDGSKMMQVGPCFKTRAKAKKFGEKTFKK